MFFVDLISNIVLSPFKVYATKLLYYFSACELKIVNKNVTFVNKNFTLCLIAEISFQENANTCSD
jgi:hypothetical protein